MFKTVVPKWLHSFIESTRRCRGLQRLLLRITTGIRLKYTDEVCDMIYWGE